MVLILPVAFTKVPEEGGIINVPAILVTMFLCILLVRGTKETVMINRIFSICKISGYCLFSFVLAYQILIQ